MEKEKKVQKEEEYEIDLKPRLPDEKVEEMLKETFSDLLDKKTILMTESYSLLVDRLVDRAAHKEKDFQFLRTVLGYAYWSESKLFFREDIERQQRFWWKLDR